MLSNRAVTDRLQGATGYRRFGALWKVSRETSGCYAWTDEGRHIKISRDVSDTNTCTIM